MLSRVCAQRARVPLVRLAYITTSQKKTQLDQSARNCQGVTF